MIIKIMMIRITVEVHLLDRRGDPVKSSGIFSSKHTPSSWSFIGNSYWQHWQCYPLCSNWKSLKTRPNPARYQSCIVKLASLLKPSITSSCFPSHKSAMQNGMAHHLSPITTIVTIISKQKNMAHWPIRGACLSSSLSKSSSCKGDNHILLRHRIGRNILSLQKTQNIQTIIKQHIPYFPVPRLIKIWSS